jgi:hypothetical protein
MGEAPSGLAAPTVSPGGGVGEWSIGTLGPHQDVLIALSS